MHLSVTITARANGVETSAAVRAIRTLSGWVGNLVSDERQILLLGAAIVLLSPALKMGVVRN